MTKEENIVVSLELAKKLKSSGWEQKAIWFWTVDKEHDPFLYGGKKNGDQPTLTPEGHREYFACPTAEELLRELPVIEPECDNSAELTIERADDWEVSYKEEGKGYHIRFTAYTLANASAEMWIYLKEHNLLSPSKDD